MKISLRKKSVLAYKLLELEIHKLIIAATNQYFLTVGFSITNPAVLACYNSPDIRAICEDTINEAFRSHPSDRE